MKRWLGAIALVNLLAGCTHTINVRAEEPITINMNIKIEHEIRIKVDKELEDVFKADPSVF